MWGTSICPAVRRWQRRAGSARCNGLGAILLPPLAHHLSRDLAVIANRRVATFAAPRTAASAGTAIFGGIIGTGTTSWVGGNRLADDLLPDLRIRRRLALLGINLRRANHTGNDDQQPGSNIFHERDVIFQLGKLTGANGIQ